MSKNNRQLSYCKPPTRIVLLTNANRAGGIAYNIEAITRSYVREGIEAKWISINTVNPNEILKSLRFSEFIITTSTITLLYAALGVLRYGSNSTKIVQIIYHPSFASLTGPLFRRIIRKAISELGTSNVLYYCDEALYRTSIEDFDESKIIGLCSEEINNELDRSSIKDVNFLYISTVGRFVKFKIGYLKGLIRYVLDHDFVRIDIVGFGDFEDELKILSKSCERIIFHGKLSRSESIEIIANSDLYVGMGTTLVDATWVGIPAIIAEENPEDAVSHGYFHDQCGFGYGEMASTCKTSKLIDVIESYRLLGLKERKKIAARTLLKRSEISEEQPHIRIMKRMTKTTVTSKVKLIKIIMLIVLAKLLSSVFRRDYH